jgi:hypothetical protein
VRFTDFLTGGRPPFAAGFEVAERAGCDLNPIDATTEDGRLTLLACSFPDESDRFDLLERATAEAPLALLTFEGESDPAVVETQLTVWPGGRRRLLARSSHHPVAVEWVDG